MDDFSVLSISLGKDSIFGDSEKLVNEYLAIVSGSSGYHQYNQLYVNGP